MKSPVGINIIGAASSNTGLGVVTRAYANALIANGHPLSIFDLDIGGGRSGADAGLRHHFVPTLDALLHDITIWVMGAKAISHYALMICRNSHLAAKLNVAMVWWELPDIPPLWATSAQAFDAIICATDFVREAWANHISQTPVLLASSPLQMPPDIKADRARFSLPDAPLLFYSGFEAASDPVRKNPLAAVQAFKLAFPDNADVRLVVKVNNPSVTGKLQDGLAKLYELAADDKRVIIIQESLSYPDLMSLYASCDVVISLHRSEGLGLIPLEAMRLGKVVVATGWSGNMTYMNHTNAALVRYDLVPTDESATLYSPTEVGVRSRWAEPSIEHAASWLRTLARDAPLRLSIGKQAKEDSHEFNHQAVQTRFVRHLLAIQEQRSMLLATDKKVLEQAIEKGMNEEELRKIPAPRRQITRARRAFEEQLQRHLLWRFERKT